MERVAIKQVFWLYHQRMSGTGSSHSHGIVSTVERCQNYMFSNYSAKNWFKFVLYDDAPVCVLWLFFHNVGKKKSQACVLNVSSSSALSAFGCWGPRENESYHHVSLFHRLGNEIPIRLKIDGLKTIWGFLTPRFIFSRMNSLEQSQTFF